MPYEAYESITAEKDDGVVTITFHRPEKYNALSTEVYMDLARAFAEIQLDREVDAVVITGEGDDAFCSGADIGQYAGSAAEHDPRQKDRQQHFYESVYRAAYDLHPPVIAKINGYCVGGGLILASFCDLRIAVDDAKFGVPTTDIGQIPGGGSTYRVTQLVGEAKVKELVYTAGMIDADEARDIGFVNRVVERDELDATVDDVVAAIQDTGRQAVKNSKRAINFSANAPDIDTAREREAEIWWEQFATEERERLVDEFNE
ncbi:enoyl-CoA hydratase/isomerase family protein [Haloplanus halophilus]|uniref:enoyl-CoA hydratase/isomerase family protein n=1 Tax=Haloplanus halophilus TaxID=2949993 RepID=UPI00203C3056|nr:enoyl-CoA hydratase/isomerase family protein [Haloplanus sp. GDY1]